MFPINKIKKEERSDENSEINEPNSDEFKIEVKMEDTDPTVTTNIDNSFLNPDCVKLETNEFDFDSVYIKDEFDEVVKQEFENNKEIINRSEITSNHSSKKGVVLPKDVYFDMKSKIKAKLDQAERKRLEHTDAELSTEVRLLKAKNARSLLNLKKHVALLKSQAMVSDAKLEKANITRKHLQNKIDELQTHVYLLSTNNWKLEMELNSLRGKSRAKQNKKAPTIEPGCLPDEIVSNILNEDSQPSLEVLKGMIVSLVREKTSIAGQLDKKTAELKKIQEKYGKTIMELSKERRKTEELMKNKNSNEKKKSIPFVWAVRK